MAGPGYSGYFMKGLASGIQTGVNFGMQIYELKWQKEQRKKLKEKEDKIKEGMTHLGGLIKTFGADKAYSDDEIMQLDTVFLASVAEVQAAYKDSLDSIKTGNKRRLEEDFQWLDLFIGHLDDLDLKDVQGLYDMAEKELRTEKARNYFTAYKSLREKRLEAAQPKAEVFPTATAVREAYPGQGYKYSADAEGYVPTFEKPVTPKAPAITDYNAAWNHLMNWANVSHEAFSKKKTSFQKQFPNVDMTDITQEALRSGLKPTPEGEITAGEKRTWDMASSVLFGSSDFVTGISKPGIISSMVSSKLNMGQPLTEEENTEVRNNYNSIKGTLPGEVLSIVESQLKRYGVSLEIPKPRIELPTEPISKPKQWWEFWKEGTTPTPEITPKVEEIPSMKVPAEEKLALIPTMTKEEVRIALRDTDPADPLYKALYDWAVKQGWQSP